jgi:hypothetical protein
MVSFRLQKSFHVKKGRGRESESPESESESESESAGFSQQQRASERGNLKRSVRDPACASSRCSSHGAALSRVLTTSGLVAGILMLYRQRLHTMRNCVNSESVASE